MAYRLVLVILAVSGALALAGCGGSDNGGRVASEVRLLNVAPGYEEVDMYAAWRDEPDTLKATAVPLEAVSDYVSLDADTFNYEIRFRRAGASSTLLTLGSEFLESETRYTYVTTGSEGRFGARKIDDTVESPDADTVRVQVMNAAEAGSVDVYLVPAGETLDEDEPTFSGVSSGGSQSGHTDLDSGSYRLRITGNADAQDLRLDVPELQLSGGQVLTLVLVPTDSAVLLDALLLPQGGAPEPLRNTLARVRAAHGSSTGSALTASVGDVTLFANATPGIVSQYQHVPAGTPPQTFLVNGQALAMEPHELDAGVDYTLLAWHDAGQTRIALLADDNGLPSSGSRARLRVVHAAAGVDAPVNLSIDFFPVIEGVNFGQASGYAEVDPGSDVQLDVFDATTAQNLWSRDGVSIAGGRVYTLFVSGNDSASPTGTMRRDR